MSRCPSCQSSLPPDAAFCDICGAQLDATVEVPQPRAAPTHAPTYPTPQPEETATQRPVSSNGSVSAGNAALIVALAALSLATGLLIGWLLFGSQNDLPDDATTGGVIAFVGGHPVRFHLGALGFTTPTASSLVA